jgi:hypothetical protein
MEFIISLYFLLIKKVVGCQEEKSTMGKIASIAPVQMSDFR